MVLQQYSRAQLDAITANEPGVRQADPDAIHDTRVAVRRLRSTLRTFRPLLQRERSEALRAELHWLAGLLGNVRDAQVMAERLASAVAAEPPELVLGPVAARIRGDLAPDTAEAHRRLVEALDGPRYTTLLEGLDGLVQSQLTNQQPPSQLRRLARKALRRADDQLASADAGRPEARDVRLHEARKAYKRARYAAEALVPVGGAPARRLAKRLSVLQDVLGAHQDTVVTGERLRALGIRAYLGGDNAFTYGLLHARQYDSGERRLEDLRIAVRRANRGSVRRWLKG